MTNKKKQNKQKPKEPRGVSGATASCAVEKTPPPDGTYARYKRCTELVHEWCDALVGMNSTTLSDWADGMSSLAKSGEKMPVAVRNSLDMAIALRDEANAFYRAIAAAEAQQRRHWYVCKLLRHFRRLFSPRTSAQPAAVAPQPPSMEPSSETSLGFEALEIETVNVASDDEERDGIPLLDLSDADNKATGAESSTEDDLAFALACLMADAARTREELRQLWAEWAPADDDHGAALLGATSRASYAITKLERAVNATQLILGLPDANLSTLADLAPPRVRLHGLQAKPELNERCGELRGRDAQSGRYIVVLDGSDTGAPPVRAKAQNVCGEHGWDSRADALVGILQQVGRALADFDHAYMPPRCSIDCHYDPSTLLDMYVSGGALWQWTNYAQGIGNYGASETLWRRHMRSFVAQREAARGGRDVSFIVAFMIAMSVEMTVSNVRRGLDVRPIANGTPVMLEMRRLLVSARATLAATPISGDAALTDALMNSIEALEYSLESEPTAQSNTWLAGDVLDVASRCGGPASLAAKVMWRQKSYLVVMVHMYHALRCTGYLRAIAEVDAFLRVFRRSVFFRTEQLPTHGSFSKALALAIGGTASSVSQGSGVELKSGRVLEYTGINPSEWSVLRYVSMFHGAGLEEHGVRLAELDFVATAREEVAVLHQAPSLAGALKLLKVRDAMRQAGIREAKVLDSADGKISGEAAESAVPCWEAVFPGCGCTPPAVEAAAVPLVFSRHTHVDPTGGGLKGAYTSSYTPTTERLSREQLKQKYRDGIAATRARTAR